MRLTLSDYLRRLWQKWTWPEQKLCRCRIRIGPNIDGTYVCVACDTRWKG